MVSSLDVLTQSRLGCRPRENRKDRKGLTPGPRACAAAERARHLPLRGARRGTLLGECAGPGLVRLRRLRALGLEGGAWCHRVADESACVWLQSWMRL